MKREVLLLGDPALYEVSAAVTRGELEQLRPDIEDMFECLQDAGFGHGISAPQIGIRKRLICLDLDGVRRVIVNPTLELVGSETMELMDDCLCFPGLHEYDHLNGVLATMRAVDGKAFVMKKPAAK